MEKPWIIRLECDFCFHDQNVNLYQVDMKRDPMSYVACENCCREKGWWGNE